MPGVMTKAGTELLLFINNRKERKLCLQESIKLIFHHPMK